MYLERYHFFFFYNQRDITLIKAANRQDQGSEPKSAFVYLDQDPDPDPDPQSIKKKVNLGFGPKFKIRCGIHQYNWLKDLS